MTPVPPSSIDLVAQRIAAEKAQLDALCTEPEMEIIGVTSTMGAGAMGSAATDEWSLRLSLLRWRAVEGTRRGEELVIRWVTNEQEIDRLVEAIPGPMAVRMRVRLVVPPAQPATPMDAFPAAILVALLDDPVDDAEMITFAAKLQAEEAEEAADDAAVDRSATQAAEPMTMEAFIAAVKSKQPPASEAEVAALEESLGCKLPADYRAFLIACNGGFLSGTLGLQGVSPIGEPVSVSIHHVEGLREEPHFSISWARQIFKGRIPDDLLMIMDDPSGNAICLGLRGPHVGKLFWWDHENEPDDDWDGSVEGAGNIQLLADSFAAFVAWLRPTGL